MSFLNNLITAALIYATGGTYAAYYAAAAFAIGTYNDSDARRRMRHARDDYNRDLKDRFQMVKSATEVRSVVYGRARVSGPIVYAQSTGDKAQYLHLIVALAGHECDAVETIYLNDVALPTVDGDVLSGDFFVGRIDDKSMTYTPSVWPPASPITISLGITAPDALESVVGVVASWGSGFGDAGSGVQSASVVYTVDATAGTITLPSADQPAIDGVFSINIAWRVSTGSVRVRVRHVLGTDTQAAFAECVTETAGTEGAWTSAHQLLGICAVYLRLEFDQDVFGQIGLPNVSAVVRGKKVRDPRTGATAWSSNPALCLADRLTDARYGLGATLDQVPDAEVAAAADVCDQMVDLGEPGLQRRYSANGVIGSDAAPRESLDRLREAMAGSLVWVQGRWLIRAGAHRAPVMTITDSDLAGPMPSVRPWAQRRELINSVTTTFADAAQAYTETQAPQVSNALYLADDGGVEAPSELQCDMCTDVMQAQRLAKIVLERSRQAMVAEITCNLRAYDLAPSDVVALTLGVFGWNDKVFEVVSRTLDPQTWTVRLVLRETAAGVWEWAYGEATTVDLTPNTTLRNPHARPPMLTGVSVESGASYLLMAADGTVITRARVIWTQSTDAFVTSGGRIELQWRAADVEAWNDAATAPGDAVEAYLQGMPRAGVIYVRARTINSLGRASDWRTVRHDITGKDTPHGAVTGLGGVVVPGGILLSWARPTDPDYWHTDLRLGATWSTAALLYSAAGTSYLWPWPGAGSYTLQARHVDTSGNESAASASISITVAADGDVTLPSGVASQLINTPHLGPEAATSVLTLFEAGPAAVSSGA